jgi:Uma2 family endonuclease
MTAFATDERLYTISEYLEMEERSEEKHEYYNGKITLMAGGSTDHSLIATNISMALYNELDKRAESYLVLNSEVKIFIPRIETFVYPDAVVVCEKIEHYNGRNDIITNPFLVVEVASPSTAKYDRTLKFRHYKTLPSFKEYVIVEQDFPWVIASFKTAENTWNDLEATQLDQSIFLRSINCSIDLKRIYKNVEFAKPV